MSRFWDHYAAATNDIRHKLVEEGWYGRQVTGDVQGKDLEGSGKPHPIITDESSGPRATADRASDPAPTENDIAEFYASTRGSEAAAADLYGEAPAMEQAPAIEPAAPPPQSQSFGPEP